MCLSLCWQALRQLLQQELKVASTQSKSLVCVAPVNRTAGTATLGLLLCCTSGAAAAGLQMAIVRCNNDCNSD
jgi:hypothetical protein